MAIQDEPGLVMVPSSCLSVVLTRSGRHALNALGFHLPYHPSHGISLISHLSIPHHSRSVISHLILVSIRLDCTPQLQRNINEYQ